VWTDQLCLDCGDANVVRRHRLLRNLSGNDKLLPPDALAMEIHRWISDACTNVLPKHDLWSEVGSQEIEDTKEGFEKFIFTKLSLRCVLIASRRCYRLR
jgi:hypothetical protein